MAAVFGAFWAFGWGLNCAAFYGTSSSAARVSVLLFFGLLKALVVYFEGLLDALGKRALFDRVFHGREAHASYYSVAGDREHGRQTVEASGGYVTGDNFIFVYAVVVTNSYAYPGV